MQKNLRFGFQTRCQGFTRLWLALASILVSLPAIGANFLVSLDPDTVTVGETATLTLKFEGGSPTSISGLAQIPNLQIRDLGNSQSIQMINGQTTISLSRTLELTPAKPGEYVIPALHTEINGQKLDSQPVKLTALKPGAVAASSTNSPLVFVKLIVPKTSIYVGETFNVEVDLFLHQSIQGVHNFHFTSVPTDGFTGGNKWVEGSQRQQQIGNAIYRVVPLTLSFTAIKTGSFEFGPLSIGVTVDLPGRRGANPFGDDFYDPFGMIQTREQREVSAAAEAPSVRLLPLPDAGRPAEFNGAVGTYNLSLTAGPTNVAAGDPITLHVQISGRGALDSLALPEQKDWENFKLYPPTAKIDSNDPLGVEGTKTFELVVIPQQADIKSLPPFSFSFFDPEKKVYRTLTQPPIALVVRPGGQTMVPTTATTRNTQENTPKQDIVAIKQRLGSVATVSAPLVQQPWFLGLQALPVLAFFSAFAWRKRSDALANNPRLRRQRRVEQIIRDGLVELRKLAGENKSDEFFATLFRLLQEQLGARLDVPASSITEAVIDERLRPAGVSDTTLTGLHELFQACNMARYAPIKSSQELASFVPKLETVLANVKAELGTNKSSKTSARLAVIAFVLLLAGSVPSSLAAGVPSDFDAANRLYEQGRFSEAAAAYEKLVQTGVASPALYFNLGNAYFKSGQAGRAIAAYRHAEKLAPRDPDVRANLQFVRRQIPNPTVAPTRAQQVLGTLTINEWGALAMAAFWLTLVLLTLGQIRPALKQSLRSFTLFGGVGTLVLVALLGFDGSVAAEKTAIIIAPNAVVRNGPLEESPSAFIAHDGAELRILDAKDNWLQVAAAENRIGWIKREQVVEDGN